MDHIVLGEDTATGKTVSLGIDERRQGVYIIGKTGTGKTTLIEQMVVQDMTAGLGVCLLDPHGDLIDALLRRIPPTREKDVIFLDLADSAYPFGLNLFECHDLADENLVNRVATQAVEIFEKLWGDTSWGPRVAQTLRNCAYTLIENQGYTMAEIPLLLLDEQFRDKLVSGLSNEQARQFWELQYNPRSPRDRLDRIESTLNKVDEFLSPTALPIVGLGKSTVDFRRAMDQGAVVLVRLSLGQVGARTVSLVGSVLVAQILNAAVSRQDIAPDKRRQFNLYADEYHRFATPAFAELLAEARKYAVATTLAHQYRGQLEDEANRGATLNAANLIVFAVSGEDADELAKQFDRTPPPPEITGQRPKLSFCQKPIEYLIRHGHEDDTIRWIVQRNLAPWVELATSDWPKDDPMLDALQSKRYPYASKSTIQSGLALLDAYFVKCMEQKLLWRSAYENRLLAEIIFKLFGLMRFVPASKSEWATNELPDDTGREIIPFLEGWDRKERILQEEIATIPLAKSRLNYWSKHGDEAKARDRAATEFRNLIEHLLWIVSLGAGLSLDPILIDTGQWEPIYDRPRTYADVEAEIASKLVSSPKYTARCRILEGTTTAEHTVHTPEYRAVSAGPKATALAERIRERTRDVYCAPRATVIEALRARQKGVFPEPRPGAQRRVSLSAASQRDLES